MITKEEWHKIHSNAFRLHRVLVRMLGDKHCEDAHPDVMGGCSCTSQAIKMFIEVKGVSSKG